MQVVVRRGALATASTDVIVLTRFLEERSLDATARAVDVRTGGLVTALVRSGDFSGRLHEIAILYPASRRLRRVMVLGLGKRDDLSPHRLLQAMASASRRARDLGARTLASAPPGQSPVPAPRAIQAIAEGAVLGVHRFERRGREGSAAAPGKFEIVVTDAGAAKDLAEHGERGAAWARSVCDARDLANAPGNELTPARLADAAREVARASGANVQVLGVREMERLGMGAVLAVGKGSVNPPRFIVLDRGPHGRKAAAKARGSRRSPTIVLIGKGVTFDTGGISIKPREGMARMKYDMAGAAAVLGVFAALPSLDLPFRVVGLVPSAENMPDGRAFKPGDVVRAMDGTAIEITNTDAEGRLVLADALVYARRFEPDVVVDLATLTGAISLALGHLAAGLFTHDDALAQQFDEAALVSGERLWRMPLWEEYGDSLRSDVADFTNSGAREGGASTAAVFLGRFAKRMPWVHLDIASTAWAYSDRPHEARGPTGFGVRLLLEWLMVRAAQRAAAS